MDPIVGQVVDQVVEPQCGQQYGLLFGPLFEIMFKQKLKILALALLLTAQQIAFVPAASAATLNARAYGNNTIAGYPSLLKTSLLKPGKKVVFVVEKPDRSVVQIATKTNAEGYAKVDLYGQQTKKAGVYKVAFYYPGTSNASPQNTFAVFADKTSATQSILTSTTDMVEADGMSHSFVTVNLYDAYKNPVQNHFVKLISSRPKDEIEIMGTGATDKDGRVTFKITSRYTGASALTAIDTSSNVVLEAREQVVFYAPVSDQREIGGNYMSANLLYADTLNDANVLPGPVASFDIEDLGSSVKVNTDQTITVVAKDSNGNVAKNYTGTILISTPDDPNSTLPGNGEYTFKQSDQGRFTFNLALRFSQLGTQTVEILDKENWNIKGEFQVNVVSQQAVNPSEADGLMIKSPLDGAVFGNSSLAITGQGDPNINLKLFVDDFKVADSETDTDGFFSYQLSNLSGGTHRFYVMSEKGQVSDTVTITVDTLPPVINSLQITPDGPVAPGKMMNVMLSSEPELSEVSVRIQGVKQELFPAQGQPGNYSGAFAAPAVAGNYPLDVILVDDLSNKSELLNQKTIVVQNQAVSYPPQVLNLDGVAGDGSVTLSWDPITTHNSAISTYHIYYGTDMNALNKVVKTTKTPVKLTGLSNGTQYFFAVTAVDAKGVESEQKSQLVAITPQSSMPVSVGGNEDQNLNLFDVDVTGFEPQAEAPVVTQEPTVPQASLYNNPLMGTPADTMMTLSWEAFPGVSAAAYKVYFGLKSGEYDDYQVVSQTTATVKDLINNVPYYFAVVAVDADGKEISPLSAEFSGIPSGSAFHSAAQDGVEASHPSSPLSNFQLSNVPSNSDAGATPIWIAMISLLTAGGFYGLKRRYLKH